VKDTKLRVVAHEVGHAIVDQYFMVRSPYNIHELLAQFTEKHITD
jgi:Zn-dependent membrane protease YugP